MATKILDSQTFVRMLTGGAEMLSVYAEELNKLNVFPVADGDTGTNMLKTLDGSLGNLGDNVPKHIGDLAKQIKESILLSARGNSGVILSQIFTGICEKLEGCEYADVRAICEAYKNGVKKSYQAVQNPTEGTILTVFRESTEYAAERATDTSTLEDFLSLHIEEAKRSLERTKELLPALKEADVIDSGAAGYLCIVTGMYQTLLGKKISYSPVKEAKGSELDIHSFTRDSVLEYGYCTEFLIRLMSEKVDPDTFEINTVIDALKELSGESIVAYKQDDIVKVHVHTFTPGAVINKMQEYGEFLTVKIENMSIAHTDNQEKRENKEKPFSVVAVCDGDGMKSLLKEMGADITVDGGQSKNPSIEELVNAFKSANSKEIIVLPNNKNVILAANQAAKLYTDATVHVIKTKNMAEGYSALSVINPGFKDINTLLESAERAARDVISAEITEAVRNATLDGVEISMGDYLAIGDGELKALEKNPEAAVLKMLEGSDIELCEIITLFVGKSVTNEKRAELTERLKDLYTDYEITVYDGGQDVFDYIVAVE